MVAPGNCPGARRPWTH